MSITTCDFWDGQLYILGQQEIFFHFKTSPRSSPVCYELCTLIRCTFCVDNTTSVITLIWQSLQLLKDWHILGAVQTGGHKTQNEVL